MITTNARTEQRPPRPSPALAPGGPRVLILGDSIAAGAGDMDTGEARSFVRPTFVDLLRAEFPACTFDVDAVPLRRAADLPPLLPALLERFAPHIVLLAAGSNDSDIDWRRFILTGGTRVRQRSRPAEYEAAVRAIHAHTLAGGASLILTEALGLSVAFRGPVLDRLSGRDVLAMMRAAGGQAEADRMTEDRRGLLRSLAAALAVPVARIGQALETHDPRSVLGPDGFHPSAAGHRVIADALSRPLHTVLAQLEAAPRGRPS